MLPHGRWHSPWQRQWLNDNGHRWQGQCLDDGGRHDQKHGGDQGQGGWHDQGHGGDQGSADYWRKYNAAQKAQKAQKVQKAQKAQKGKRCHQGVVNGATSHWRPDPNFTGPPPPHGRTRPQEWLPAFGMEIRLTPDQERTHVTKPAETPHERKDLAQRLTMREREMSRPSNPAGTKSRYQQDGIRRQSESVVYRGLWPYGQKLMNEKAKEELNIDKWWDTFVDKWKKEGQVAVVRSREKTAKLYAGGEGNYFLTLSGIWRWQGFFCF